MGKMSLFNDNIKKITLKEFLVVFLLLFLIQSSLNIFDIAHIPSYWIYILLIFYFIYKSRGYFKYIKADISDVFKLNNIKDILYIVVLNIFISYAFLYLSDYIIAVFPDITFFTKSIAFTTLFSTIFISPISEEFIFRGVFLNRFKLIVPHVFAVILSSLIFASLHSYGSIFSAFIFSISISVLYLKSENIFIPVFAHFLNNLIAEVVFIFDSTRIIFNNNYIFYIISFLAVLSFILILNYIVKELNTIKMK